MLDCWAATHEVLNIHLREKLGWAAWIYLQRGHSICKTTNSQGNDRRP